MDEKLEQWWATLEDKGIKISRKNTEYLSFKQDQDCEIRMQQVKLKMVDKLKYPSSVVTGDGKLDKETAPRIQAG